jgi:hypothetical protein
VRQQLFAELGHALLGPLEWDGAPVAQEISQDKDVLVHFYRVQVQRLIPDKGQSQVQGSTAVSAAGYP